VIAIVDVQSIGGVFVPSDVREPIAIERLVRTAFGGLDIMFNDGPNSANTKRI